MTNEYKLETISMIMCDLIKDGIDLHLALSKVHRLKKGNVLSLEERVSLRKRLIEDGYCD